MLIRQAGVVTTGFSTHLTSGHPVRPTRYHHGSSCRYCRQVPPATTCHSSRRGKSMGCISHQPDHVLCGSSTGVYRPLIRLRSGPASPVSHSVARCDSHCMDRSLINGCCHDCCGDCAESAPRRASFTCIAATTWERTPRRCFTPISSRGILYTTIHVGFAVLENLTARPPFATGWRSKPMARWCRPIGLGLAPTATNQANTPTRCLPSLDLRG
jgi:hypothetical protein